MRKLISTVLIILLILCAGCGKKESIDLAPVPEKTSDNGVKQDKNDEISNEQFTAFFKDYFAFDENDVLLLNQNPPKVNSDYWKAHDIYKKKLVGFVKVYFAEEIIKKLNSEFLYNELDLPKKLAINEYVTFGPQEVEKAEIISVRTLGDHRIYEIGVTTRNKVQPSSVFNKNYTWDAQKGYYIKGTEKNLLTDTLNAEQDKKNTYLNLQAADAKTPDEIKLVQNYWVELQPNSGFRVQSIKEASPISVDSESRQKAENNGYVTRIAYNKEASAAEQSMIKKVFTTLMNENKAFYNYYEKAAASSFDIFKDLWQTNMRLDKEVLLVADYYQDAFSANINPYKDGICQISADMDKLVITPSAYSTQKQPRFIVTVPVKALFNNNETVNYNYKYYVGMEQNKIECINFMNMETVTEPAAPKEGDKTEVKENNESKEAQPSTEAGQASETEEAQNTN